MINKVRSVINKSKYPSDRGYSSPLRALNIENPGRGQNNPTSEDVLQKMAKKDEG